PDDGDVLARAVHDREQAVLNDLPKALRGLPTDLLPLRADNMVGLDALTRLFDEASTSLEAPIEEAPTGLPAGTDDLETLVDELAQQDHGLLMFMGKGGVGKTTIASAVAVALAERGHDVHLTTTDPAAHLADT